MLIKERTKSTTHLVLESLNSRMNLSFEDAMNYQNQIKGWEGECFFDQLINHPHQTGLIINDLLLKTKNTYYQIDSLFISNQELTIYEIKNYSGKYTIKDGMLFAESGHFIQNPLAQVERKKAYLHNLLLNMGYQYTVSAYVAYVNPEFYIYEMPPNESILFYGQLKKHFQQLPQKNEKKWMSNQNFKVANYLVSQHQDNYPSNNLPEYSFKELRKGLFCPKCFSFKATNTRQNRICASCGYKEKIADAIYRGVLEFKLLFPEMKITVQNIEVWCGNTYANSRIQVLLTKKFNKFGKGPGTYYT